MKRTYEKFCPHCLNWAPSGQWHQEWLCPDGDDEPRTYSTCPNCATTVTGEPVERELASSLIERAVAAAQLRLREELDFAVHRHLLEMFSPLRAKGARHPDVLDARMEMSVESIDATPWNSPTRQFVAGRRRSEVHIKTRFGSVLALRLSVAWYSGEPVTLPELNLRGWWVCTNGVTENHAEQEPAIEFTLEQVPI